MSFADKKGIVVASPFILQAKALLDARGQVETIADRDELVTINAATEGLQVYVKANKTAYVYNGSGWDEVPKGNMSGNLNNYVQKEEGKGLSSNDYTDEEKAKLESLHNTTVDSALSDTSTNPVQNKIVKGALDGKVPTGRKVNGKALTADIALSANDVSAIPASQKGAAGGVAELDSTGKVPAAQLPSYVDDVIEGYMSGGKLYVEAAHTTEITGEAGKIYVDLATNKTYRWSGTAFAEISASLALGTTSSTAGRGDWTKAAYDHSQAAHAPSNAQKNVQPDWNVTDTASDAYIKNKPTSMPADGGDADTVGGHTVGVDVPANAKFTDTVYTHPSTHAATMITQDATHRFVTDVEKEKWNAKPEIYFGSELPTSAPAGSLAFVVSQ
ncbi:MAG: hypothetical protein Q4C66_15235 [Lachnospiraceae bacterium]|nr:hypothetical protein [Lachnospiraceae bacterium]